MDRLGSVGTQVSPALPSSAVANPAGTVDLEIKDAQIIFGAVWKQLEQEFGRERLSFPKELILLGGAPGSGKGTNSDFIRKVRDITAAPASRDRARSAWRAPQ